MTASLTEIRELVDAQLHEFLEARSREATAVSADAATLTDVLDPLLFRGKRIRAALCVWGYQLAAAAAGTHRESPLPAELVRAATSLELLHLSALIHDDMMDGSDTRRGQPTIHRRFEAFHDEHEFSGNAEGFGSAGALIAGDLCLGWSMSMFSSCGMERAASPAVLNIVDRMRSDVMIGQYLDMLGETRPLPDDKSIGAARTVVKYKSAKYSVEHPLLLGAALAGADEQLLHTISSFGMPLGEAFQLRDDVLGVFGDPHQTGKPAGDDLRSGKRTVMIAYTRAGASAAEKRTVDAMLGDPDLNEDDVSYLRGVIERSGGLARTEQLMTNLAQTARSALSELPPETAEVTATLEAFSHELTGRKS
ncbi:polyprenyl synthetase family protein [Spelaeicoccus albus]|uniref:Geranylgeranyl diphosphate synthase type I n=1 Tax=Spelaeicoccus albus TaxID=1280376 RepID=A0A7Z0IJ30_9MICO|nr:polyprenyl synthetase family protein [Spelaeicoccus albus]NYI69006.1 geranylgeranyl diphosphate synthase type I [Spelaeicoccus albus]